MLNDFISYLQKQVDNHSMYVWGGQGEKPTEKFIRAHERGVNLVKALAFWNKARKLGFGNKMRCFDCSGLGMYWLITNGIYSYDMTANGMMSKGTVLKKSELRRGDWVFRTKNGVAKHIGYIVDDDLNVIEAKGRAYGVTKTIFSSADWDSYRRPACFASEIKAQNAVYTFSRLLRKYSTGEDVKALQRLLNRSNNADLAVDGQFGSKTLKAVKQFQKIKKLKVDGIAGEKTITALGGNWVK